MTLNYLKEVCRARSKDLGDDFNLEIQEIYDFARDEISSGESEHHEVELALDALDDLTQGETK